MRKRRTRAEMGAESPSYIPPEVIEEAVKRLSAPRDVTQAICGDPPKGFSALERRA